jgi:hypothetical protein
VSDAVPRDRRAPPRDDRQDAFASVRAIGLSLSGVEAVVRYDGAPGLTRDGRFMAALACHQSAEPASLVVRASPELREALLREAPESYYLTPHYERHPVVLARLDRLSHEALADLLRASWRLSVPADAPEIR